MTLTLWYDVGPDAAQTRVADGIALTQIPARLASINDGVVAGDETVVGQLLGGLQQIEGAQIVGEPDAALMQGVLVTGTRCFLS